MKSKNNLLIVTNFIDNYRFFKSIMPHFISAGYSVRILTNKYSIYRDCSSSGIEVIPLINRRLDNLLNAPTSLESLTGTISKTEINSIYTNVYSTLEELHHKQNIGLIFMWSGIRVIEKAADRFAEDNSIPKMFFELSNLPDKIFADPLGTNANSLLYKNPSILDSFEFNERNYNQWRENYIELNLRSFSVPQSKNTAKIDYTKNILDLIGVKLFNYQKFEPVFSIEKYKNKLKNKHLKFEFDSVDLKNDKYIFFPLQVSDDAQILMNSSVDNLTAIEKLSKIAAEKEMNLLVKPHPAERNFDYVLKLNKLKSKLNFKFITGNMFQIMINAEEVYTINSTAGLQARILGKNVHFFGKSFYSKLNEEQIGKYITSYLLDLNFWAETQNAPNLVETIENSARLN